MRPMISKFDGRGWLAASVSLLALTAPALAKADAGQGAEASDVIVVTATRTQLTNFDYPGLTSAISLQTLDENRPTDLIELLEDIPALQVSGGPRRTGQTLSLRGLGRENVTLLIDGARQNFNSAHDGVLFLDPALLGRVESVRGSASSLYGSGAAGGVIAFETLEADDLLDDGQSFGVRASAGYRSVNEESRGSVALVGDAGNFEGVAALSVRQSGDIELGSGDALTVEDDIVSGLLGGEWDISDALELELGWLSFRNDSVEPNNGQGAAGVDSLNPLMNKDVSSDSLRATLRFAPSNPLINLETTLYHNIGAVDETDESINRLVERDLTTTGIRAENRAEFALGGLDLALVTGVEWYEDEQKGFDSATPTGVRGGVPSGSTRFTGVWAQLESTLDLGAAGELIVLPGVRFDQFESESDQADSNDDDAISPRLAATWAPNDSVRVFGSWAEAFRAPSLNELYLSDTHFSLPHPILGAPVFITNSFIANPDLKPEHTETLEIGAAFSHQGLFTGDDRFEIKGAWFQTDAEDLINLNVDFAFNPTCFAPPFLPCSAGTTYSENLAEAELEGFEIAAAYSVGAFELSGSLFEVDGENKATGEPLGALQPVMGFVNARYTFEAQRLTLGGRVAFAADFDKADSVAQERDGYAVLDLHAGWTPLADQPLRINLGVDNVFDEDYERVFAGVSEAGRSVRIDLTWTGAW
ncbi:TonB-dependent receptor domain-containing protein [Oceanicaulis alexandrii]|uniref:TonB-dependent receptor domain-containing protein n=1 Tax=Oceanicaulis alexandrii TaxID=153233 RepID=UPI001F25463A|nr:TonB-dependent receptor [Oceanicaulis alexandrii]